MRLAAGFATFAGQTCGLPQFPGTITALPRSGIREPVLKRLLLVLAAVAALALIALVIRAVLSPDPAPAIPDLPQEGADRGTMTSPGFEAASGKDTRPADRVVSDWQSGTIRGQVRTKGGDAIGGAIVRAVGQLQVRTEGIEGDPIRTSADGSYEIGAAGATSFALCAEAKGFAPGIHDRARIGDVVDFELDAAGTIDGLVIDDQGAPVAGVEVFLLCLASGVGIERATISDRDGKWQLTDLPAATPDMILLNAEAAGFASYLTHELRFNDLALSGRFTIVLRRGGTVRGTLLDGSTGKPIAGGKVEIARTSYGVPCYSALARFRTLGEAVTDAIGGFSVAALSSPGYPDDAVSIATAAGYAPSRDALPAVGDGRELRLHLRLWPAAGVKGRVVDPRGRPVGAVRVFVDRWWEGLVHSVYGAPPAGTITASDGSYRLDGIPANGRPAELTASAVVGQRGEGRLDSVPVRPGEVTQAPDLVLHSWPAARIRVRDQSGRPVAGALVEVSSSHPDLATWFTDAAGAALVSFPRPRESGDPEYVRVSAIGYVDQLPDPFVPSADAPPEIPVTLVRALEMTCHVRWADESDAEGVQVAIARATAPIASIWPVRNEPSRDEAAQDLVIAKVETDERGRCRFRALPPPPWHLAAWGQEGSEPSFRIESFADASKDLLITLEDARPATRAAPETTDVDIVVVDAVSGRPVLDATVYVDDVAARPSGLGIFRREAVPRGAVKVSVSSRDYPKGWRRGFDLRVPGNERIEARLIPAAVVRGRATFPRGTVLTGGSIYCRWSEKTVNGRSAPIQSSGDFELRGVSPGVDLEFTVQGGDGARFMTFVPMPFRTRVIPPSSIEFKLDLDFVPASFTTCHAVGLMRDSWDLTVSAKDGSWTRDWPVWGRHFGAWMPVGPVVARCVVYGSAPVTVDHAISGEVDEISFTVR